MKELMIEAPVGVDGAPMLQCVRPVRPGEPSPRRQIDVDGVVYGPYCEEHGGEKRANALAVAAGLPSDESPNEIQEWHPTYGEEAGIYVYDSRRNLRTTK